MTPRGHSSELQERSETIGSAEGSELLAVPIPHEIAAPFIREHHYSKTVPTGKNVYFGCYFNSELYAVANYGSLASRTPQAIITGKDDATADNTVELRRLCRLGEKYESKIKTSKFLRHCHRLLKPMGIRYVLSYSDWKHNKFEDDRPDVQHRSGGIYLFAGFKHIGKTPKEWHVIHTASGASFHRGRAYKRMLAHNIKLCGGDDKIPRKATGNRDRIWPSHLPKATENSEPFPATKLWSLELVRQWMGFERVECPPKDKWLLDLGAVNKP